MLSASPPFHNQRFLPFLLIFFLLATVYCGSLHTGWQMDDRPNITGNPGLRIDNLMPESLWGTFFANQGKTPALFRPLPCLSFALNWYAGRDNPFGYHVVNLGCHMATAMALYLLIMHLLMVSRNDSTAVENIALLSVILWAANPIQTQAVTYIVQRMAIMATLFYVLGMLFYVQLRTADTVPRKWAYGIACFLCFLCGVGSKENAVLLPVSMALVEWVFFRHGHLGLLSRQKALVAGSLIVASVMFAIYVTLSRSTQYIITGYEDRPFTMMERVMTQPRIVLGYLSQIFWPIPERLSIAHDVTLSTSLFHPWTTLPAMILVMGLVVIALVSAKRFPLASFAVLFYFLNHVVESSVLPLELLFEHRNYLPSLFLFLPAAAGIQAALLRLPRTGIRHTGMAGVIIVILIYMGFWTHTRNNVWATSESLWRDAALKAPGSVRPLVTLGIQLAWRDNPTPADYRHALVLFNQSLTLSRNRTKEQSEILGNIASVYSFQNNYAKAIEVYQQAIAIDPAFYKNRSDLIKSLVMAGRFEEAKQQAKSLIAVRPDNLDYQNIKGFILLWQGKNEEALICFQNAIKNGQKKGNLVMNLGVALTRTGYLDRGRRFLSQAIQNAPGDPIPVFAMIENRIQAGDFVSANGYAQKLLDIMPASAIVDTLNALPGNYRFVPIPVDMIRPALEDAMGGVLKQLAVVPKCLN